MLDQVFDIHRDPRRRDRQPRGLERVVERRMNGDQRVHRRDLEQTEDAGIDGDDAKAPARVREPASGAHQRAYSGRVEERAAREVDHDDARTPRRRAPPRDEEPSRGRPRPRRAPPSHPRAPTRCERQNHPTWPPRTSLDGRAGGSHGAGGAPDGRPHRAHDPVGPAFPERGDARPRRHREPRRAPVRAHGRPATRGPERARREQLRRGDASRSTPATDACEVALGPVREGSGGDPALARVLSRLVDEVSSEHRDGAEWLTLALACEPGEHARQLAERL